jgi:hypothetical protein
MINLFRKKHCPNCTEASRCKTRKNIVNEIIKFDITPSEHSAMRSKIYRSIAPHCPNFRFL